MSGIQTTATLSAAFLTAALCIAACDGGDSGGVPADQSSSTEQSLSTEQSPSNVISAEFAIESLPLDLAADVWQWSVDEGSFPGGARPPVHIFGKDYEGKVEVTLMFEMLKVDTTVFSPISGQVVDVREQPESCDVELYIGDGSAPPISLDHIVTTLQRGDVVTAGQPVGTVPQWNCTESYGGFEFMVIGESSGEMLAFCPADYFSNALMEVWKPALVKVMNDWNTLASDRGYVTYSSEEIVNGVCATPTAPL
jgi:hypothetical protein